MRIAFLTETFLPKTDGIVTTLCQTVSELQRRGDETLIIAPDGGVKEYCGSAVHGVPGFRFPLYPELKLAIPRPSVGVALRAFRPDIIHVLNPALLGIAAFYFSKELRVGLVTSYHTDLQAYLRAYRLTWLQKPTWDILRISHNRARLNLCPSDFIRQELEDHGLQRVAVWPGGVDLKNFDPDRSCPKMREQLSAGDSKAPLLLYVGRLSKEKGVDQLKTVLEAIPGTRLAIVGDGPERHHLEQHFAGTRTHFAGYMHGKQLAAAFASADVFVFPSRTETLGLVLLEAMAAGCPVVAAAAGGILNAVTDGKTGLLYDPDNIQAAIDAVKCVLQNPARRAELRANGFAEADRHSWASTTDLLRDYYRRAIAKDSFSREPVFQEQTH